MTHLSSGLYIEQQKSADNGHTRELSFKCSALRQNGLRRSSRAATSRDPVAGGDGGALGFFL